MNNQEMNALKESMKDELQKIFINGMYEGAVGVAGAVYEMTQEKGTPQQKIEKIKDFCRRSLDLPHPEVSKE